MTKKKALKQIAVVREKINNMTIDDLVDVRVFESAGTCYPQQITCMHDDEQIRLVKSVLNKCGTIEYILKVPAKTKPAREGDFEKYNYKVLDNLSQTTVCLDDFHYKAYLEKTKDVTEIEVSSCVMTAKLDDELIHMLRDVVEYWNFDTRFRSECVDITHVIGKKYKLVDFHTNSDVNCFVSGVKKYLFGVVDETEEYWNRSLFSCF